MHCVPTVFGVFFFFFLTQLYVAEGGASVAQPFYAQYGHNAQTPEVRENAERQIRDQRLRAVRLRSSRLGTSSTVD